MPVEGVDELVPIGYVACRGCGSFLQKDSREGRNGRCDDCHARADEEREKAIIAYEVQGRVFESRPMTRKTKVVERRRRAARPKTDTSRLDAQAKRRAERKLARIYAPQFEMLLAHERCQLGLDPRVRVAAPRAMAIEDALLADIKEAEEREARRLEARQLRSA